MSTTSFVGKGGLIAPRSAAYQMIHLMNMQHSTGKAAHSLSSYSVVLAGRQWGWGSVAGRVEPLGCGFLLLASHLMAG